MVARDWGKGMGTATRDGVSFWGDGMFWNYTEVVVYDAVNVLNTPELYMLKG